MQELRKFFDHLHAQEDITNMQRPLLLSATVSIVIVALVAPLQTTVVCMVMLVMAIGANRMKLSVPFVVSYGIGVLLLLGLKGVLPGGATSREFITSLFAVLSLCQCLCLRRYWHGELLLIWLLACNASTSLLDGSATLTVWLIFVMFFNLGQMLRLHLKQFSLATLTNSLRSAIRTTAYALPMLLVFIYVFQRSYETRRMYADNSVSGVSGTLEPGKVSKLALRSGIAYRVATDKPVPELAGMYWRVATLSRSRGMTWSSGKHFTGNLSLPWNLRNSRCYVTQTVFGQENDTRMNMLALDRPIEGTFTREGPKRVMSYLCNGYAEKTLSNEDRKVYLKVEGPENPQVKNLVAGWLKDGPPPAQVVTRVLHYFKDSGFKYNLAPQSSGETLGGFLFSSREGFCEHYAAALGSLLRLAGIPARVVVGFQGGTFNPFGNYWLISYQDAHAWTEYWNGERWTSVDATATIAPQELTGHARSLLRRFSDTIGLESVLLGLDSVFFEIQQFFSGRDRLLSLSDLTMDPFVALGSFLLLFVVLQVKKIRQPLAESVREQFLSLCLLWANHGPRRARTEGYESYRTRVVQWMTKEKGLQNDIPKVNEIFQTYGNLRFGPNVPSVDELKGLILEIKSLKKKTKAEFRFHFLTKLNRGPL